MPIVYSNHASTEAIMAALKEIPGVTLPEPNTCPADRLGEFFEINVGEPAQLPADERNSTERKRQEEYSRINSEVVSLGIEALAWYRSFHVISEWGIYIKESSLYYLAETWLRDSDNKSINEGIQQAWQLLWAHEIFHFATDLAIARWEIALQRPLWAFDCFRRKKEAVNYWRFEEQAANAHMIRYLGDRWSDADLKQLREFTQIQPPGYRDAIEVIDDEMFLPLLEELIRAKVGLLGIRVFPELLNSGMPIAAFFDLDDEALAIFNCPVYLVRDAGAVLQSPVFAQKLIAAIPEIEETPQFKKMLAAMHPHFEKRWHQKKRQLEHRVPCHPEFEKFKDGPPKIFSIRLNKGARVHLEMPHTSGPWKAVAVGQHKEMGHG